MYMYECTVMSPGDLVLSKYNTFDSLQTNMFIDFSKTTNISSFSLELEGLILIHMVLEPD